MFLNRILNVFRNKKKAKVYIKIVLNVFKLNIRKIINKIQKTGQICIEFVKFFK